jgi:serine phosphatase RsbU (regulator of sigma subunit)/PAS domain-containing protein
MDKQQREPAEGRSGQSRAGPADAARTAFGPPSASHAPPGEAGAVALAATVSRLRAELRALREDFETQALVALAKGVLVERLSCGPAQAGRQLEQLAAGSRMTLPELAADIINETAGDAIAHAAAIQTAAGSATGTGHEPPGAADPRVETALRLRTAESAAMLAGDDTQTVVRAVLDQALSPTHATAAALWAAAPDGSLTLAGEAGFGPAEAARWRYVPPGVGTLAQQAVTEHRMLWVPDPIATPLTIGPTTGGTRAVLPAKSGARQTGVLEIRWPDSDGPGTEPTPALRRQLDALADLCALTLGSRGDADSQPGGTGAWLTGLADGLLDSAMLLRPLRGRDDEITDFLIEHTNERFTDPAGRPGRSLTGLPLLDAYPLFAVEGGLLEQIQRVYATGVPHRMASTILRAPTDQTPAAAAAAVGLSRFGDAVLLTWRLERGDARQATLLQHAQRLSRIGAFEENLITGEITWNEQLHALHGLPTGADPVPLHRLGSHVHPDDTIAINRFLRTVLHNKAEDAVTFRLQRADGVVRHMRVVAEPICDASGLLAVRGAYQDVSSQHWTEVALAATRDRLAGVEQHAAERHRLARQLQQAILPPADQPVHTSGLRVAVRYRAAEEDNRVGGDWYDAAMLPNEQVLLAVGDVAGHSITAVNGMIMLRNALRGLAVTGAGPGRLLSWLNSVAYDLTEDVTGTAVCGIFEPGTRTLRWARAGHLPPILVRDGAADPLPMPGGMLLGAVAEPSYEELRLELKPHDTLLMYTDGLIERRDSSLQDALNRLLTAASHPFEDLDHFLDHLLSTSTANTADDACLIGIQPH